MASVAVPFPSVELVSSAAERNGRGLVGPGVVTPGEASLSSTGKIQYSLHSKGLERWLSGLKRGFAKAS